MKIKIIGDDNKTKDFLKEVFWLAWNGTGGTSGAGLFQDNPTASKDDIFNNIINKGDYPGGAGPRDAKEGKYRADYVFGRCMKMYVTVKENEITIYNSKIDLGYQTWGRKYSSYKKLFEEVYEKTGIKYKIVEE